MGDDPNSWIRRANFSHTICHRLDSSVLVSIKSTSRLELRPIVAHSDLKSKSPTMQIPKNNVSLESKPVQIQRSTSPLLKTLIPHTFKEARSDKKRYSTPTPQRKEPTKTLNSRIVSKLSRPISKIVLNVSPIKTAANLKSIMESSWSRYFNHGGVRVTAVEAADEWMIDLSKLFLGLKFAHGAHSRIYHGVYMDNPVAVKIIQAPDNDEENRTLGIRLEKQFNREAMLLSRLHHENVIRFVGACSESPVFFIVAEFLTKGSLRAYLHKLEKKSLSLEKLIGMSLDIARGMEFIHSYGIIHRDLKPENVLISEEFRMKIADFGIACEEAWCDALSDDPGTLRWMAPEMIKHKSYGRKVDVYSFGLILWEMVSGTIPYADMTPIQAAYAVVNKNFRPIIPANCPPGIAALIQQCWSLQPEKRPEFWQIVKILEQFETLLAVEGTLNNAPSIIFQNRKGFVHLIHKID